MYRHASAPAARGNDDMVGHLLAAKDFVGFCLGVAGCYFCGTAFWAALSPTNVVNGINQFFVQASALVGTLGCFCAAVSIAWQNFSKARKQMQEDIVGNKARITDVETAVAEKDRRIAALMKGKAEDAARITDLERQIEGLHQMLRHNSGVVAGLKMESDLRKATTPDPDVITKVEIINTRENPVPTTLSESADAGGEFAD